VDAYAMIEALFFVPIPLDLEWIKFQTYIAYSASLMYNYLNLLYVGYRGMQNAQAQAHQMIFNNLQIEEAEKVKETGEKGVYESVKSDFAKWIESQDFKGDSFTYSWKQYSLNPAQGKEVKEEQENWVRSEVEKPSANALLPVPNPAMPLTGNYFKYISPCTGPPIKACVCPNCASCWNDLRAYWQKYAEIKTGHKIEVTTMVEDGVQTSIGGTVIEQVATASSPATTLVSNIQALKGRLFVIPISLYVPQCIPCTSCSPDPLTRTAWMDVIYLVPIPFIVSMLPEEVSIKTEVTRYEPSSDLGLFQNKPAEVKSGAKATTCDGNVMTPHSYKIKLEETW
jgi:hypothetical protein